MGAMDWPAKPQWILKVLLSWVHPYLAMAIPSVCFFASVPSKVPWRTQPSSAGHGTVDADVLPWTLAFLGFRLSPTSPLQKTFTLEPLLQKGGGQIGPSSLPSFLATCTVQALLARKFSSCQCQGVSRRRPRQLPCCLIRCCPAGKATGHSCPHFQTLSPTEQMEKLLQVIFTAWKESEEVEGSFWPGRKLLTSVFLFRVQGLCKPTDLSTCIVPWRWGGPRLPVPFWALSLDL